MYPPIFLNKCKVKGDTWLKEGNICQPPRKPFVQENILVNKTLSYALATAKTVKK